MEPYIANDNILVVGGPGAVVGAGRGADAAEPDQQQAQDHLHLQPRRPQEPLHGQTSG